jgi:hypothetical protein
MRQSTKMARGVDEPGVLVEVGAPMDELDVLVNEVDALTGEAGVLVKVDAPMGVLDIPVNEVDALTGEAGILGRGA